ncbi:hypothetical protein TSUD_274300 [Trifolium subterraneum]|uniref:NAC domain-containing protein n=1 Tax=Trifolium subterraneum TaxID=3900 RepID=A0A2Z6P041_TRISU|nr:hypothetical protein TSUD_274300 [Trifolium subterraneum]
MAPMTLPPGFRFHPTDEELVAYYLERKITGRTIELDIIAEVDLYKCEPWDLPVQEIESIQMGQEQIEQQEVVIGKQLEKIGQLILKRDKLE